MKSSVALCTYNGAKYLQEQLDSIINQTVKVFEIVVCDDGSKDETMQILERYCARFPGIFKISQNDKNLGYERNFEQAISLCSGDIIFLCDQDDVWFTEKVEKVIRTFQTHPEIQVVAHDLVLLRDKDIYYESFWKRKNFSCSFTNTEILNFILFHGNVFPGMTISMRSEFRKTLLPMRLINKKFIHDYEIVIRSAKENSFFLLDVPLTKYRIHSSQNIGFKEDKEEELLIKDLYYKKKGMVMNEKLMVAFDLSPDFSKNYLQNYRLMKRKFLSQYSFPQSLIQWLRLHYYRL